MGQTFIASLLSDMIIDARSAVRMAVCSYCQRINATGEGICCRWFEAQVVVIFFQSISLSDRLIPWDPET
jgi:hypothetical protein